MVVDFNLGPSTFDPPTPDAYILDPTANPNAGVSRLCWGWRSDLEVAIRECRHKRANKIVAQRIGSARGKEDIRAFAECNNLTFLAAARGELKTVRLLVEVVGCDIEALHSTKYFDESLSKRDRRRLKEKAASKRVDAVRRMRGYSGTSPLNAAAHGEPGYSREKRDEVVKYLLARGADPMRPNDSGIYPLFISCANYNLEMVRMMLGTGRCDVHKTISDGESPLSIAERNVRDDPNGEIYRPLLDLVNEHLAATGRAPTEETDPAAAAFGRAVMKKQLGNEQFRNRDYAEAADLYNTALFNLGELTAGKEMSDEEKDLRITVHSNSAEAFLQLGAFVRAKEHCESSLRLDPSHAKSKSRLRRAREMETKYRAAEKVFEEKFWTFCRLAEEQKFSDARAAMEGTDVLAAEKLDPFHQVRALLAQAEMLLHLGTSASAGRLTEDEEHLERADRMANDALIICHNYMRRIYELDRSSSGNIKSEWTARLLIKEASSWFLIAQIYRVKFGHDDPSGFAVKLQEAKASLDKAEHEMGTDYIIEEAEAVRFNIREAAVTDAAQLGNWDTVLEVCKDSLDQLRHYIEQGSRSLFDRYAPLVSQMAECLAHGARREPVRSLMYEMLYFVADTQTENGDHLSAAKTMRKIINYRHTSWQYHYPERVMDRAIAEKPEPPNDEEASHDNSDVARLLNLLKVMGREDDGSCSICLEPLEGGHPDVLSCLHMFHTECIRRLFDMKYAKSMRRDASGNMISTGECPNCREKIELKLIYASPKPISNNSK